MREGPGPSPFLEHIGAAMEEWREGYARYSLRLEHHHTNPNGVMHGGVVTSLMDEVTGRAVGSARGHGAAARAPHATVEMNVSFLAALRPGDEIVVEGRVLRLGRTVAFAEAEARRRPGDELIARGRFTFVIQGRGG